MAKIVKNGNFLGFEFRGQGVESEHLRVMNDAERSTKKAQALELAKQGKNTREIGEAFRKAPTKST